jgi:hypothetical protein
MKWFAVGMVLFVSFLWSTGAMALTPASQAIVNRRLVSNCMSRQMAASRTLSYNEASKLCKDRIKSEADALSASNQAKPANAR